MTYYFYFDQNNQKQGPISEQQIQTLAVQGVITPNTPLETDTGHKGVAGQIPGLNFNAAAHFAQTASQTPNIASAQAMSILMWLFDFAFRDIRLSVINLWACRILYVIGVIAIISVVLMTTIAILDLLIVARSVGLLFVLLFVWIIAPFNIIALRMILELEIIALDHIIETTKAARLYVENNKKGL